jgi:hypothetical protein
MRQSSKKNVVHDATQGMAESSRRDDLGLACILLVRHELGIVQRLDDHGLARPIAEAEDAVGLRDQLQTLEVCADAAG